MRGVNKFIGIGTLGKDPESRTFGNGGSVCNFSIAISEVYTDKSTGEEKEHTEWVQIVLNNRLGEIAQQYLRKGSKVYIEGSLRTRKWQDKATGQDRYATEVRGDSMQMLDSPSDRPAQQQVQQPAQSRTANGYALNSGFASSQPDDDSDLPF